MNLEQAEVSVSDHSVVVRRVGKLPGSDDWTHQHGDIANTVKSDDHRVKLPLGVLWFGGSSNLDVLPRHGHGPPEQVIGGRLFIEGMNSLSARDVYTGAFCGNENSKIWAHTMSTTTKPTRTLTESSVQPGSHSRRHRPWYELHRHKRPCLYDRRQHVPCSGQRQR